MYKQQRRRDDNIPLMDHVVTNKNGYVPYLSTAKCVKKFKCVLLLVVDYNEGTSSVTAFDWEEVTPLYLWIYFFGTIPIQPSHVHKAA